MKKLVFILSCLTISLFSMAQSEGSAILDWAADDNSFGLNRWIDSATKEKIRRDTKKKEKRIEEALEAAFRRAQQQNMLQQQKQQQAAREQQIRNHQQQIRNQQIALQRQRQKEMMRKKEDEERRRREELIREEERHKREETRQRVTAETYQQLERQTRSLQATADWNRGEGARQMLERYDIANVMEPLNGQPFDENDLNSHLPKQKFTLPLNGFVIDPERQYYLATWDEDFSDDLSGLSKIPMPVEEETEETQIEGQNEYWEYAKDICKNIAFKVLLVGLKTSPTTRTFINEGFANDTIFESRLRNADEQELKKMRENLEQIDICSYLADESYKDENRWVIKDYTAYSEADDIKLTTPLDKKLNGIVSEANNTFNQSPIKTSNTAPVGFQCELYKSPDGTYTLSFRGTSEIADLKADAIGAFLQNESQSEYARKISKQIIDVLHKEGVSNDKIIVTGHSLGGRLAQEAALETGVKAYIYNSADLSLQTKTKIKESRDLQEKANNIVSIVASTDPLTIYQNTKTGQAIIGDNVLKNRYVLHSDGGHSMSDLRYKIGEKYLQVLRTQYKQRISKQGNI